VLGQVVGCLGQAGADDEGETGVLKRVQVCRREHPGVGDDDHVRDPVAGLEGFQNGDEGGRLCLAPLEQVHLQREPAGVHEEPDLDLRVDAVLLAHADLAQRVLVLEVERGDVIEHHRRGPGGSDRVAWQRFSAAPRVFRCGAATPRSSRIPTVAAFEAGSTSRASIIAAKASSPRTSNPRREYPSARTAQRTSHREPATTAEFAGGTDSVLPGARSSSKACWPAFRRSRPARTKAATPASSWAEPRCSRIRRTPERFSTI
jgi:hypothetical protein